MMVIVMPSRTHNDDAKLKTNEERMRMIWFWLPLRSSAVSKRGIGGTAFGEHSHSLRVA